MTVKLTDLFKDDKAFTDFIRNILIQHAVPPSFKVEIYDSMEPSMEEHIGPMGKSTVCNTLFVKESLLDDIRNGKTDFPKDTLGFILCYVDRVENKINSQFSDVPGYEFIDPIKNIEFMFVHECRHIQQFMLLQKMTNTTEHELIPLYSDLVNFDINTNGYENSLLERDANKYGFYTITGKDEISNQSYGFNVDTILKDLLKAYNK